MQAPCAAEETKGSRDRIKRLIKDHSPLITVCQVEKCVGIQSRTRNKLVRQHAGCGLDEKKDFPRGGRVADLVKCPATGRFTANRQTEPGRGHLSLGRENCHTGR